MTWVVGEKYFFFKDFLYRLFIDKDDFVVGLRILELYGFVKYRNVIIFILICPHTLKKLLPKMENDLILIMATMLLAEIICI